MIEVGTQLKGGRWNLDARIASGGVSTVFSATHRNGSRAAIKVLDSVFTEDEDMRRRFLHEGYASNKVGHPGAVRVLDDDVTEEGRAYLVMELLEGEPLDQRRVRLGGKLPLAEALQIAHDLLDVLAAAHAQGIIHRDIKPANLFLTTSGQLKVLDFGFAKVKEAAQAESTAIGTLLGTPGFLAPERARGESDDVDARTDIWSAGATIFTLISGAHVHEADTSLQLLVATARNPTRSLGAVEPSLPRPIVDVIDRALAFDKADRWPSASAMQDALRDAADLDDETKVKSLFIAYVDAGASGHEQTTIASGFGPPSSVQTPASMARPPSVRQLESSAKPVDQGAAPESRPLPRLYDDRDEGDGGKGFTQVLPSTPRWNTSGAAAPGAPGPAPDQGPHGPAQGHGQHGHGPAHGHGQGHALAHGPGQPGQGHGRLPVETAEGPRRSGRVFVLLVAAALALVGIAMGIAALLPSAR